MKTLVLDTTELRRDWMLAGFTAQLLGQAVFQTIINVYVPSSVFEELIAHHRRHVADAISRSEKVELDLRRLGITATVKAPDAFDYRAYLTERFDETLSFNLLPWPTVSHEELVARAVDRRPPFDEKGGGYRDSLVWASVLELVKQRHDVVLVSADGIFAGSDQSLSAPLQDEVAALGGHVELVRDLAPWLLRNLPWRAATLQEAVAQARDGDVYDYFLNSDAQSEIEPAIEDIGFDRAPYKFAVTEVEWSGDFNRVGTREGPDGLLLVEYDIGEAVSFEAELPDLARLEEGWEIVRSGGGRQEVMGSVHLVARIAVLFDDEFGMTVEDLSWRRADGTGGGAGLSAPDLDTPLF